jgi:hypothetical protein
MEKKQQNFKLPQITITQLEKMARKRGLSKTAIVILAIDEKYQQEHGQNGDRTLKT